MQVRLVPTLTLAVFPMFGQPPQPSAGQTAMERAVARQRASVAAMSQSVAKQNASVQKQAALQQNSAFFSSPPLQPVIRLTPPPPVASMDCDPLPAPVVDTLVGNAAGAQAVDEKLLRSVIQTESAFHPCAVSPKGAMGLMQLMPATAQQFGVTDPFDPVENINAGAKFLHDLLGRYNGDLRLALGAYNAGPATVDAAKAVPAIPETVDYVNTILNLLNSKH